MRNLELEAAREKAAIYVRGSLWDSDRNEILFLQSPASDLTLQAGDSEAMVSLNPRCWIKNYCNALVPGEQAAQGSFIFVYFNL